MIRNLAFLSLILAVVFEASVVNATPGLGHLVLWTVAVGTTAWANRSAERPPLPQAWMFLPSLAFATSVTLYDAAVVRLWSTYLGLATLLWAAGWNLTKHGQSGTLARLYPKGTFHLGRLFESARLVWRPLLPSQSSSSTNQTTAVLRGLCLALPLLLLFGVLLAAADQTYEHALSRAFGALSLTLPLRLLLFGAFVAGWLRLWLDSQQQLPPTCRTVFGAVEMRIVLGSLNLLFASFLVVQAGYLFDGMGILEQAGLTHATYARRGFFELSTCIALILPVVMLAYQTAVGEKDQELRGLGAVLILQTVGLAVSAYSRMLGYIEAFGLSIDRFYAAAGILVALVVLGWAALACVRPRDVAWVISRQIVTILFLLSGLSLVNVERLIVQTNIERARQGRSLDVDYLQEFSADAIPALKNSVGVLEPEQREAMLLRKRQEIGPSSGLSWNLSRALAKPALARP